MTMPSRVQSVSMLDTDHNKQRVYLLLEVAAVVMFKRTIDHSKLIETDSETRRATNLLRSALSGENLQVYTCHR